MEELESIKLQIRMVNELLEKKAYQNDLMRKHLEKLQTRLKELENVQDWRRWI